MVKPKKGHGPRRKGPSEMQRKWEETHRMIHELLQGTRNFTECKLNLVGSTMEGTKVDMPDEFDCCLILPVNIRDVKENDAHTGFIELYPANDGSCLKRWLDLNGRLDAEKLKETFHEEISGAAKQIKEVDVKPYEVGKAAQPLVLPIEVTGSNRGPPQFGLDIDLVPAITLPPEFKPKFAMKWENKSPMPKVIKDRIFSSPMRATVKTPAKSLEVAHLWRVSASSGPIFQAMREDMRTVYPKLKVFLGDQVENFHREFSTGKTVDEWKHMMPSYNIKNAVISTYENNIGTFDVWTPKEFALQTLKTIADGITNRGMKHFMTNVNILKKIEDPDVAEDYELYKTHVLLEVTRKVSGMSDSFPVDLWIPETHNPNFLGPARSGAASQGVTDAIAMAPPPNEEKFPIAGETRFAEIRPHRQ